MLFVWTLLVVIASITAILRYRAKMPIPELMLNLVLIFLGVCAILTELFLNKN